MWFKDKKILKNNKKNGFTLIEIAIILILIGLLIGLGASLIGPLTKRIKVQETRERIDAAVESVLGFAIATKRLPNGDEFLRIVRNPEDAWGKDLRYVVWGNFTNVINLICSSNVSQYGFKVNATGATGNRIIENVAFLIMSSGPNYNLQTRFENRTNNVWYIANPSETITIHLPGANKDDYQGDGNSTDYDDIVRWVTVYELMSRACYGVQRGN
ncbi:MAG: prepilin-type N-terminal cleavage/methylation domain-containing protein [Desulfurococcaceae archaeon]